MDGDGLRGIGEKSVGVLVVDPFANVSGFLIKSVEFGGHREGDVFVSNLDDEYGPRVFKVVKDQSVSWADQGSGNLGLFRFLFARIKGFRGLRRAGADGTGENHQ